VLLHGSGGDQWEIPQAAANLDGYSVFAGALEQTRVKSNFLMCAPLARGPSGYVHVAEVDILQMLEEVQRDYAVDPDRVYLLGWSMGGAGAFLMASRFPDRFAAMMPVAGSADSSLVENARHVPCWNYHGLGDTTVSPGYLRIVETAYRALGLPYHDGFLERPFVWGPWADHWVGYRMMGSIDEIEKILGTYRRVASPKEVTLVTPELRHNASYWVRIDAFESYVEPGRLVARSADNTIEVTSQNVRAFTLLLSHAPVDANRAIRVLHNGRLVFEGKAGAELTLGQRAAGQGPHKIHGLSGPLSDIYYEPFLIVVAGPEATDAVALAARKQAESMRATGLLGNRFFGVRIKSEPDVTAEDIDKYHLIVFGSGNSSTLLNRIMGRLPVRIEGNAVAAGDRRFPGEDVGFRLIYPNPLNPRKYVVVCAGVSSAGLEGLGSIPAPNYGWLSRVSEPDVLITDRRARGTFKRYLAAYTFDNDWKLEHSGAHVGHLDADLSVEGMECSWGNFRADAIREATDADIALVEVDDHLYPLELTEGDVSRSDLAKANNWAHIYTLEATGTQIRAALEHSLQRWFEGTHEAEWFLTTVRPLAVSGFSYAFQRTLPDGERVKVEGLESGRTYRVAVTEHVLAQATDGEAGAGYLGWLPMVRREELNEIEAQLRYLSRRGHVRPPREHRITGN
jgi:pimeloyl-ACP methyl ester carboxylesterase